MSNEIYQLLVNQQQADPLAQLKQRMQAHAMQTQALSSGAVSDPIAATSGGSGGINVPVAQGTARPVSGASGASTTKSSQQEAREWLAGFEPPTDAGLEELEKARSEVETLLTGGNDLQQKKLHPGIDLIYPTMARQIRRQRAFAPDDTMTDPLLRNEALQLQAGLEQRINALSAQQAQMNMVQENLAGRDAAYRELEMSMSTGGQGGVFDNPIPMKPTVVRPMEEILVELSRRGEPAAKITAMSSILGNEQDRNIKTAEEARAAELHPHEVLNKQLMNEKLGDEIRMGRINEATWSMNQATEWLQHGVPMTVSKPFFDEIRMSQLDPDKHNPAIAESAQNAMIILTGINQQKEASLASLGKLSKAFDQLEAAGATGKLLKALEGQIGLHGKNAMEKSSLQDALQIALATQRFVPEYAGLSTNELLAKVEADWWEKSKGKGDAEKKPGTGIASKIIARDKAAWASGENLPKAGVSEILSGLGAEIRDMTGTFPTAEEFQTVYGYAPPSNWDQMDDTQKRKTIQTHVDDLLAREARRKNNVLEDMLVGFGMDPEARVPTIEEQGKKLNELLEGFGFLNQ